MTAQAPAQKPAGPVKVLGIAGWKNSGKTTLTERLISELTRRGYAVSSLKHAHHNFQIDTGDTDSARHRRAGAGQVAIVSPGRWAVITELKDAPEPSLTEMLSRLAPCDLVIVEGFKRAPIPKIEARRQASAQHTPLSPDDRDVIAIAADHAVTAATVPVYDLDDIVGLADMVEQTLTLRRCKTGHGAPA
jgi:molybdopterin-guanine dinucleotide biosynthesis adapter protein